MKNWTTNCSQEHSFSRSFLNSAVRVGLELNLKLLSVFGNALVSTHKGVGFLVQNVSSCLKHSVLIAVC